MATKKFEKYASKSAMKTHEKGEGKKKEASEKKQGFMDMIAKAKAKKKK